ncbi:MAG TPA: hypothetical protein VFB38_26535 [Chthonomonadaceae bacterium]|nr:hypothetical protein [Chthonomonadaceae bacterium]
MTRRRRHNRVGLTLLELVFAMALAATLTVAIGYAFVAGLDLQRTQAVRRAAQNRTEAMQQRITRMLQGAKLTDTATDTTTFFVGEATGQSDNGDLGCDQLTFTTIAPGVPMAAQLSGDDFETQHNAYGPIGGVAEVSYSTTPVGDAGDQTGLFERIQRPSDGDPTQGGLESLLAPEVERMGFQFWDGLEWVDTWDTLNDTRRLPAAVKVSYTLRGARDNTVNVFVVPIPASDVTAQNPVTIQGSAGGAP